MLDFVLHRQELDTGGPTYAQALEAWLTRSPAHRGHKITAENRPEFGAWWFRCETCNRLTINVYTGALTYGEIEKLLRGQRALTPGELHELAVGGHL
jgi:hypothetical protein